MQERGRPPPCLPRVERCRGRWFELPQPGWALLPGPWEVVHEGLACTPAESLVRDVQAVVPQRLTDGEIAP